MLDGAEKTLRPCPFCGSRNVGFGYRPLSNNQIIAVICCADCGASGPAFSMSVDPEEKDHAEQDALTAWQHRTTGS